MNRRYFYCDRCKAYRELEINHCGEFCLHCGLDLTDKIRNGMSKEIKAPFIKKDHIEIAAETLCLATSKCPLTEEEALEEEVIVNNGRGERVPCCRCEELYCNPDDNEPYDFVCPNFDWFTQEFGEITLKCSLADDTIKI